MRGKGQWWCLGLLLACLAGCATCGQWWSKPEHKDEERAGNPTEVAPWAVPSDTGAYVGYEVGGGALPHKGEGPTCEEGTWGWDYEGRYVPSKVILGWWHGLRYQGGFGAYKTDGPRPREELEHKKEKE